ncbi:uncharacterized protein LOC126776371 [Nymphalis io]|uniref:uncharacterized protein LOC126776371 n=1 Tax=Inachis io TaxID=171585 RepID=UPI00216833EF|nr:uncharacterized protein LOC126776371 [Nymphalis io]
MQITDALCYLLFAVTITSSFVNAEDETHEISDGKIERRLSKRDAAIFIDNFPIEPIYKHRPKVIYRRISKQRYKSPMPKYGPPHNRYRSKPRKPIKKYRGSVKPKYGPPSYKRRPAKLKYVPPKPHKFKTVYGPPKKTPQNSYFTQEPAGFGEPPTELMVDYQRVNQNFGEPPTDSYGSPLDSSVINPFVPEQLPPPSSFSDPSTIDNLDNDFGQDFSSWQNFQSDQNFDNNVAYSKKRPTFTELQTVDLTDFDLNSYSNIYRNKDFTEQESFEKKKRPHYKKEYFKTKSRRPKPTETDHEDAVLVGGHYAEPPARIVPKNRVSYSAHFEDDDFLPFKGFIDPDIAFSATMSPYVNYKHSNVAFSPQNLNDAFSIVD